MIKSDIEYSVDFFEKHTINISREEIEEGTFSIDEKIIGLYCLCDSSGNYLYLGQSQDVISRVATHVTTPKHPLNIINKVISHVKILNFNEIETNGEVILEIEKNFIKALFPLFNKTHIEGNLRNKLDGMRLKPPSRFELEMMINEFTREGTKNIKTLPKRTSNTNIPALRKAIIIISESDEEKEIKNEIIDELLKLVVPT